MVHVLVLVGDECTPCWPGYVRRPRKPLTVVTLWHPGALLTNPGMTWWTLLHSRWARVDSLVVYLRQLVVRISVSTLTVSIRQLPLTIRWASTVVPAFTSMTLRPLPPPGTERMHTGPESARDLVAAEAVANRVVRRLQPSFSPLRPMNGGSALPTWLRKRQPSRCLVSTATPAMVTPSPLTLSEMQLLRKPLLRQTAFAPGLIIGPLLIEPNLLMSTPLVRLSALSIGFSTRGA